MRITNEILEAKVTTLNHACNLAGKRFEVIGYNGGTKLVLRHLKNGGTEDISPLGTKREVAGVVDALLAYNRIISGR